MQRSLIRRHNDIIKWKHFPRYSPFARGIFPSQRSVTRLYDVLFDLRLNKRLIKQSRRRRFETPSSALWCHCYEEIQCPQVLLIPLYSDIVIVTYMWVISSQYWMCICPMNSNITIVISFAKNIFDTLTNRINSISLSCLKIFMN